MGQSESTYDFDFTDNKNNATVGNYPGNPAIISQPQTYGNYPHQDPYYAQQQQKDGYFGGGGYDAGYNNVVPGAGTGNPYPPVGQYGTPYHQPTGYQGLTPAGPPPPYPYPPHQQGAAVAPGGYFPPTHQGDHHQPPYNPNVPQLYPNTHNIMPEHGKY